MEEVSVTGQVYTTCVKNPFNPLNSKETLALVSGRPVREYLEVFSPGISDEYDIVISINGNLIETEDRLDLVCSPGMSLVFCAIPQGGGNIFRTIAMLAVVVIAAAATWYIGGAGGWAMSAGFTAGQAFVIGAAAGAVIAMGGSLLVNALIPLSSTPDLSFSSYGDITKSATYGWEPGKNAITQGGPSPVLYGTRRVTPTRIGRYVESAGDDQYLNLLFLVADHALDSITDVQINGNPIEDYQNVTIETRLGTLTQAPIASFGDTRQDTAVNTKLSSSAWVTRQTGGNAVQGLGVGLLCDGGLYYQNDAGEIVSTSIDIIIEYRPLDAPSWTTLASETITGAQTSPLRKFYSVSNLTAGQYEVRAMHATAPASSIRYANRCYFEFIEEVVYDDFSYPGASLLAIRALATSSISSDIEKVSCLAARSTVDVWTGSAYESKPANLPPWACYDKLHNDEYGGNVAYNRIPLAKWTEWAAYCLAKGLECNIYLDTVQNLRKALDTVSLAGRGTVIQMGSYFTCIVDKPEALPAQRFLFNPGNIVKDSFSTDYVPYNDRADAIEITYWDEDLDYESQVVTVISEFYESINREIKTTQITLYSITNRQQAINYGKFLLNCNRYLSLTANWTASVDSLGCLVGEVVEIGWDYGGRVMESTGTTIRCDREIALTPGFTYQITIKHQDDDTREDRTIASAITDPAWNSGNTYIIGDYVSHDGHSFVCRQAIVTIPAPETTDFRYWMPAGTGFNITIPWTKVPAQFALYSVGETGTTVKEVRVVSIGRAQNNRCRISALEYVREVYDDVATIPAPSAVSRLYTTGLKAIEKWELEKDGSGKSNVYLTWRGYELAYDVYYKPSSSSVWVNAGYTRVTSFCIPDLKVGQTYTVSVTRSGESPEKGVQTFLTILGKDIPPEDVVNFTASAQPDGSISFKWDHVTDNDLWGYEIREGLTWETATTRIDGEQKNTATYTPGIAGTYHFLIKAVDASGNPSTNATGATVTTNASDLNIVLNEDELTTSPPAAGFFTNTIYSPSRGAIVLMCGMVDTDEPNWTDQTPGITDFDGMEVFTGDYISPVYDLGAKVVFALRATAAYDSVIRSVTDQTISARTDRTYPNDTDTSITSNAVQKLYCSFSEYNITWTAWQEITGVIQADARYFKIKAGLILDTSATSFEWTSISWAADVPDKKLLVLNQAIDAAGTTITLASLSLTILKEYKVGVTVLGSSSIWPVVDKLADQFTVKTFNSAGAVASNVDIDIGGY